MRLLRSLGLLSVALLFLLVPATSRAGIFISVGFAPPILPVYEQPPCPEPNLMWTPGFWDYGPDGYFWVPGAWVPAPYEGALWTPGYWGWDGGLFVFHAGYWGPHIGYYGGVNYGFGYGGIGFAGGEWRGGVFAYNTAVVHVNETIIHTTFVDRTVVERGIVENPGHVAFAGGPGGIHHDPLPEERVAEHEQHVSRTSFQEQHVNTFKADHSSYASANGGHPQTTAISHPLPAESRPAPSGFKPSEPTPQSHAAPEPQSHPMAESQSHPAAEPQSHPAPQQPFHPAPEPQSRPAPQPQFHSAPQQEFHAAPAAPQSHPAPVSHPAPPQHKH